MELPFEFDKKKVLALIGLLIVASVLGYAIYFLFFKSTAAPEPQPGGETTTGPLTRSTPAEPGGGLAEIPPATEGELPASEPGVISGAETNIPLTTTVSVPNLAPTLSAAGTGVQYYNTSDGKFYQTSASGKTTPLSNTVFPAVQDVSWAGNKTSAIIQYPDGNKVIYDFKADKQHSIPKHWNDLSFTPDSTQIIGKTISPDPSQQYLFVARADGTGAAPIEELGTNANKVIVAPSPNDQVVAFSRTGPALSGGPDRQSILLIGKNHENFRALTVEGLGFQPIWSPKGDRVLYSAYSGSTDLKPTLWIDGGTNDSVGAAKNFLGINTWAEKCTFMNNDEVLCAVPNPDKLPSGIGFAPQLATDTDDTIYKINIRTNFQKIVGKPDGGRTIEHIEVAPDGSVAFLKDQVTGEIVKMPLK